MCASQLVLNRNEHRFLASLIVSSTPFSFVSNSATSHGLEATNSTTIFTVVAVRTSANESQISRCPHLFIYPRSVWDRLKPNLTRPSWTIALCSMSSRFQSLRSLGKRTQTPNSSLAFLNMRLGVVMQTRRKPASPRVSTNPPKTQRVSNFNASLSGAYTQPSDQIQDRFRCHFRPRCDRT